MGRGAQRCTELREGLLQRVELHCSILHAVEVLSAAQDQGRGSAGAAWRGDAQRCAAPGAIAWDEDARCYTVAGIGVASAGAGCTGGGCSVPYSTGAALPGTEDPAR